MATEIRDVTERPRRNGYTDACAERSLNAHGDNAIEVVASHVLHPKDVVK